MGLCNLPCLRTQLCTEEEEYGRTVRCENNHLPQQGFLLISSSHGFWGQAPGRGSLEGQLGSFEGARVAPRQRMRQAGRSRSADRTPLESAGALGAASKQGAQSWHPAPLRSLKLAQQSQHALACSSPEAYSGIFVVLAAVYRSWKAQ